MKRLFLLTLCALSAWAAAPDKIQSSILNEPNKAALQEKKLVFVCFGASWCGPCRKLHQVLEHDPVKAIWDKHFVTVNVVVDERGDKAKLNTPKGNELRRSLGGAEAGIPFFAFLKPDGTKVGDSFDATGQNIGYPVTIAEIAVFLKTLEAVAPTMTASDRKAIEKALQG
ncbi:MAG TPA: thioredoxin family protein [Verrucomicrobiota bacterium]|nr:thioredoxin family protein [Verrucomicrobiota bacterium]